MLSAADRSDTGAEREHHHSDKPVPASDEIHGQLPHTISQLTPAAVGDDSTASSFTDAQTYGIAATSSSGAVNSITVGLDDQRNQSDKFPTPTDDLHPEVFFDVDLHDDDGNNSNNDASNIARPAAKKKRSLLGSLRSLMKPSSFKFKRKCRSSSEIVGGAVPYVDPDEDVLPSTTTVTYIVTHQSPDNCDTVDHNEECTSVIKLNDQHTSSESVASKSNRSLSTWVDEVLTAASNTEVPPVNMFVARQLYSPDQFKVEEQTCTGTLSDDAQNQQPYTGQSEVHDIQLDSRNSPSAEFEELSSTELQETAGAVAVSRPEVSDDELVAGALDEVEHAIITVDEELQDVGTSDEDAISVNQLRTGSVTEVEPPLADIPPLQVSSSSLLHTDEDIVRTPSVHSNVEVQENTAMNVSDYINTETSDVNDDALTTDKNDDVETTGDSRELSTTEAEFDAAAKESGCERDSLAEQETIDAGHCEENTNFFSAVEGVDDDDEKYGVPTSDAESPRQLVALDSQHHDVSDDDLRHSVVIQVTEPTVSADVSDVSETVPATTATRPQVFKRSLDNDLDDVSVNDANKSVVIQVTEPTVSAATCDVSYTVPVTTATRPQVVKDKRSLESDLDDVSDDDLRHSVVIELTDQTVPTSTSGSTNAQPQLDKVKRSSESGLSDPTKVKTEVPSMVTMLLNLFDVEDDSRPAADNHATSGHCVVAIETAFGGTGIANVNDDVTRSCTDSVEADTEDGHIDREYDTEKEHESSGLVLGGHDNSFIEQSPTQTHSVSTSNYDHFRVTSYDSASIAHQTDAEKNSAEYSVSPSSDKDLNVNESGTELITESNSRETSKTSDSMFPSYRETDVPDKCQFVDRATEISVAPIANKSCVRHPPLMVMGGDQSSSSGVVDGEGISQSAEKFHNIQTTKPNYDRVKVAEIGSVKECSNQISTNQIVQQPDVVRIPVRQGLQLPIQLPDDPSPTTAQPKRTRPVQRSASDFTFTVQRPMKVNKECEKSSSTGRSNYTGSGSVGNLSEKPSYTFVVPTVRRRSDSDYNNNNLPTNRRFSTPHTRSDGQKFEIKNMTVTKPLSAVDSNKYNWRQEPTVHCPISDGRNAVRTGSVDTDDRDGLDSVQQPAMNGRLGGSMDELRVGSRTTPGVGIYGLPLQISTASPTINSLKDKAVSCPVVDQAGSVPALNLKFGSSMDDFSRAESHPNVMTSSHRCDVINSDDEDDVIDDLTRLRRHGVETASVHDFSRSEPCLDSTASRHINDVTNDDRSHDATRLRLEPIDAWRLGVQKTSARSAVKDNEGPRVSRLTVELGNISGGPGGGGDGGSSLQHTNNKRRPRRRRIVSLSHSSLASSTTNDLTSPTLTTN